MVQNMNGSKLPVPRTNKKKAIKRSLDKSLDQSIEHDENSADPIEHNQTGVAKANNVKEVEPGEDIEDLTIEIIDSLKKTKVYEVHVRRLKKAPGEGSRLTSVLNLEGLTKCMTNKCTTEANSCFYAGVVMGLVVGLSAGIVLNRPR